jgi:antitoxin (DNA-binding transcriptional repressor) of toxin-antitoxin stability system
LLRSGVVAVKMRRMPITEVRRDLCALVTRELPAGAETAVEITSRGRPVAVLLHPGMLRHLLVSSGDRGQRDRLRDTIEVLADLERASVGEALQEAVRRQPAA